MFLGLPDPGSISTTYGSDSGSFYNQAKIVRRKTLISIVLRVLYDFLPSLKNDVNVASKRSIQKLSKQNFLLPSEKVTKMQDPEPSPHENVRDPQQ
jgi:hypothetical protein